MKTIEPETSIIDPVMTEVRAIKKALAEEHNFDVTVMARRLKERESQDPRFQEKNCDSRHRRI